MTKTHAVYFDRPNGPHVGLAWFTTASRQKTRIACTTDARSGAARSSVSTNPGAHGSESYHRKRGRSPVWRARGDVVLPGRLNIYPESETNFFIKVNGAQLTFIKSGKGEVTAVMHHEAGLPDFEGKKRPNSAQ